MLPCLLSPKIKTQRTISLEKKKKEYLKIQAFMVERDVDGEGGGVVMRPQICLSARCVLHHKVHDSVALHETQGRLSFKGKHFIQSLVKPKHMHFTKNSFHSKHQERMSSFVCLFFPLFKIHCSPHSLRQTEQRTRQANGQTAAFMTPPFKLVSEA